MLAGPVLPQEAAWQRSVPGAAWHHRTPTRPRGQPSAELLAEWEPLPRWREPLVGGSPTTPGESGPQEVERPVGDRGSTAPLLPWPDPSVTTLAAVLGAHPVVACGDLDLPGCEILGVPKVANLLEFSSKKVGLAWVLQAGVIPGGLW